MTPRYLIIIIFVILLISLFPSVGCDEAAPASSNPATPTILQSTIPCSSTQQPSELKNMPNDQRIP